MHANEAFFLQKFVLMAVAWLACALLASLVGASGFTKIEHYNSDANQC